MQFGRKRMDAYGEIAKIKVAFSRNGRINLPAAGSGPLTHPSGCSSGVERNLAKVDVVGSNPIIRSIYTLVNICANLDIARDDKINTRISGKHEFEEAFRKEKIYLSNVSQFIYFIVYF